MGLRNILLARRDVPPAPTRLIGFPLDGGLVPSGVTAATSLGLSAVWRCLDILSNGVSQLTWREWRGNLELPPSRLVVRPQAQRTRREWVSLVVSTLALYDICYGLKVGEDSEGTPLAVWPLDPGLVVPNLDTDWAFLPPSTYSIGSTQLTADQLVILHRSPQPTISDTLGGVLRLARITFAAALAAEGYASRYWQSGGSTNTVLEADAQVPDAIATQITDRWRERRSKGPDYAPLLSGGVKARELGADPTTASAVEARRELVADIARYFGVPTRIVNAPTGDSETYTSTEAANMDLVRFTLQNYIGAIEDGISDCLPGGRVMRMDTRSLTRPPALAAAQAAQLATAGKAWMLPDEVREEYGLPPSESPDQLNPAPAPTAAEVPENG